MAGLVTQPALHGVARRSFAGNAELRRPVDLAAKVRDECGMNDGRQVLRGWPPDAPQIADRNMEVPHLVEQMTAKLRAARATQA
jgi:hypothetical protein